ncbi:MULTISPECIES: hypothetical protein [unclassified Bradyrhizobium]|uniref:hypothetical protein n=1 Tax=unclassified Bradyrhizobium TaxID=2631580 RepID=UPI0020B345B2|nr:MULTISPECIES: hypothetical protein [unclassified Bradyrhizobium]MCP3397753.1 hypothetical protein [Bradyrhizobium sp. CCGB20]MCP3406343.1 hypothetical protein [Bradyrhizobium sp. CCGB01]
MTLDEKIALAQRHVDRGRIIIEHQQAIVACHRTSASIDLLKLFEQTQQIFEMDLADLLKRK